MATPTHLNTDIFAAFLLPSYCSFSSLVLLSIVMIIKDSKRFSLKRKVLSYARVVSII